MCKVLLLLWIARVNANAEIWGSKPSAYSVREVELHKNCHYIWPDCVRFDLQPSYTLRENHNAMISCQVVAEKHEQVDTYWYTVTPNGTLYWDKTARNIRAWRATVLEFKSVKLINEGLYLCSVLSSLNGRMITEAYVPVTKPKLTYLKVYNEQRPTLTISVMKNITQIYVQFLVGSLFNFLNKQTFECSVMAKESKEVRRLMLSEFSENLRKVRTRPITWIDFTNLFLALFGVSCAWIVLYLWRYTDKNAILRLKEPNRPVRV
jgi:hypothetical protein